MIDHEPVAVIGMACRFPGGPDVPTFWQLLLDAGEAVIEVPKDRWNLDALRRFNDGEPLPHNATHGGWLPRVKDFDAAFFRMSPREARTLDPKQRLALEVTHEAFEDANLSPVQLRGRRDVGLFLGTAQSEYLMRFYNRMEVSGKNADRYSGPGNDASFSAGRISAFFGLEGPAVNVNTACSTSLVAVHQAIRAIREGECDVAVAGGVSIIESPEHSLVMNRFNVLSPDARCKAFDADADGYVRGEGCGMIVLRRLSDALAAGDRIHAVLRGSAVNANGLSDNLMAPSTEAQARLLHKALEAAGVEASTVDVVEAHGTGTAVGDPIEIDALARTFADAHRGGAPLHVASVKTNIGHLEVTAGIAGLIKAVLEVSEGRIPAHRNLTKLNPAIDASLPFVYPDRTLPWPAADHPRRAVVNSFGISGINAAVVIEQAPPAAPVLPDASPRPLTLLPISAVGDVALRALAGGYADALEAGADLASVAFTAATGRDPQPGRIVIAAAQRDEAIAALRAAAAGTEHPALRASETRGGRTIAWLFTGQGAQRVGMGRALYDAEPVYREALDAVDAALRPHLGRSIRDVMHGDDTTVDLSDTAYTQPALFALEVALAALWRSFGVQPAILVGHSIGEVAAAHVAGVMSLPDAASLVAARGRLMSALPRDGAMAAIFADVDTVRAAVAGRPDVDVATDNGPRSTVISGRTDAVDAVCAELAAREITSRRLDVSHAFHSSLMDPMLAPFRQIVEKLTLRPPAIPILSNLTGRLAGEDMATADYWVRHVREAVRFREGILGLAEHDVDTLIELGPSPTLIGMGRRCRAGWDATWIASLGPERPHETLLDGVASLWLKGGLPTWLGFWDRHRTARVALPRYPFQRREHWVDDPGPRAVGATPAVAAPIAARTFDAPDFYRDRWLPIATPPGRPVASGTWIVGVDRQGVGDRLARALAGDGHHVVRVAPGKRDQVRPDGVVEVDVRRRDGFVRLAEQHRAQLRGWVHTWSLDVGGDDDTAASAWTTGQDVASLAALHVSQALLGVRDSGATIVLVTRGGEVVRPGESPALGQAGPWGVARVVALEHRGVGNLRIDLDPRGGGDDALIGLVRSLPVGEDQLAIRHGGLLAKRLVPHTPTGTTFRPTPGGAWLVTGGLGALGLAVAEGLVGWGVRHVVLCGRSAPKPAALATIERLRATGATIRVEALDVADPAAVDALIGDLDRTASLRGVIHAAGVLADGPVLQQERARFYEVFPAKVEGAWNLHRATRDRDLDAFVLFSSVTSTLGAPGQVNYAAANAFLDALASYRHARGLPAVTINWGPWGEIGMAARLSELMASRGMGGLQTAAAIAALGRAAMDVVPQVAFMDIKVRRLLERDPSFADAPLVRELVREVVGEAVGGTGTIAAAPSSAASAPVVVAPVASPLDVLRSLPPAQRRAEVAARIAALAEALLGVDTGSLVAQRPLAWQGFDSVMALDLNEGLGRAFGTSLPQDAVTIGPSVDELAEQLLEVLSLPDTVVPLPIAPAAPIASAAPVASVASAAAAPSAAPASRDQVLARLVAWSEELLGFAPGELDPGRPLAWQGFDSVMALDLHRRIASETGVDLPIDVVLHGPRLTEVVDELIGRLPASGLPVAAAPMPATPVVASPIAAPIVAAVAAPAAVPVAAPIAPTTTTVPLLPATRSRAPLYVAAVVLAGLVVGGWWYKSGKAAGDDHRGPRAEQQQSFRKHRRR